MGPQNRKINRVGNQGSHQRTKSCFSHPAQSDLPGQQGRQLLKSSPCPAVFPSPSASYILKVNQQTLSDFNPVPPDMREQTYHRNRCRIRPTRLHLQHHSKAKTIPEHDQSNSKTLAWASDIFIAGKILQNRGFSQPCLITGAHLHPP